MQNNIKEHSWKNVGVDWPALGENAGRFKPNKILGPNIKDLPDEFNSQFTELVELEKALALSDILLLLVDHLPFKEINLSLLSGKQVIDTRGTWVGV